MGRRERRKRRRREGGKTTVRHTKRPKYQEADGGGEEICMVMGSRARSLAGLGEVQLADTATVLVGGGLVGGLVGLLVGGGGVVCACSRAAAAAAAGVLLGSCRVVKATACRVVGLAAHGRAAAHGQGAAAAAVGAPRLAVVDILGLPVGAELALGDGKGKGLAAAQHSEGHLGEVALVDAAEGVEGGHRHAIGVGDNVVHHQAGAVGGAATLDGAHDEAAALVRRLAQDHAQAGTHAVDKGGHHLDVAGALIKGNACHLAGGVGAVAKVASDVLVADAANVLGTDGHAVQLLGHQHVLLDLLHLHHLGVVDFIDTEAIDVNGLVLSDLDILPVLHLLQLGGGDLLLAGLLHLERHHDRLLHHLLHPHLLVPHLGALLRDCVLLIDLLPVGHLDEALDAHTLHTLDRPDALGLDRDLDLPLDGHLDITHNDAMHRGGHLLVLHSVLHHPGVADTHSALHQAVHSLLATLVATQGLIGNLLGGTAKDARGVNLLHGASSVEGMAAA
mmetsp:Transcript_20531/g.36911  ORF Transcript_20531/g.36911 Transcript_20531/m.36911 type:complete len:505 (+) Transcript_20531:360-1874(+)